MPNYFTEGRTLKGPGREMANWISVSFGLYIHYEGINNLIKRRFRLNRMVCMAWAQERMPLNSHWLDT